VQRTSRSTLRRRKERGRYDRSAIDSILDEGLVCHVGFTDSGSLYVIPMTYARIGDLLYLHGAAGNHLLRSLAEGGQACVEVTLLDGLVLARSAFHHSMNYRSVILFGSPQRVTDPEEMRRAASALLEHMAPGRSADARPPNDIELSTTLMVRFHISEGSAKVRSGPPLDDDEDLDQMSPERLRELKQEVLLRIEEIGSRDASVEPERADEIKELDDLLNEIEERLSGPETAAS